MRLGILATHPVQYHVPVYRALAATSGVDLTVYFAHRPSAAEQGRGFGVPFTWDVDLDSGYAWTLLPNVAWRARRGSIAGGFGDYDTPSIVETVRRGRFDAFLVHGWHAKSYWQAMRACWAAGVRVLVHSDSQLADDGRVKRTVKRAAYTSFLRRVSACLSPGVRGDAYLRYYGAGRIVRTPHCVDNVAFAAAAAGAAQREELRAAWGIAPDRCVVLFVGKCVARKRPGDLYIIALRAVPNAHAHIVGDGPLRPDCERAARAAGVSATWTGFLNQTEIPRAYAAADLLVLPSDRRETWGLVVNEAMASGLPVVVSDAAGCVPELVREGVTGFAFPAGDTRALASRLALLCGDAAMRTRMGAAASAHVAAFTPASAAAGVLEGTAA